MKLFLIFLGGGLGTLVRFGLGAAARTFWTGYFPLGTLLANIISCLVLGGVVWHLQGKEHDSLRSLVIIGFCGGLSTFSTFSHETLELFRNGNVMTAVANILVSTTACLLILWFISKTTA